MRKSGAALFTILLPFFVYGCGRGQKAEVESAATDTAAVAEVQPEKPFDPAHRALLKAYPDFIAGIRDNRIIFRDSTSIPYDDGADKDFVTRLDNADPQDMFFSRYNSDSLPPRYLADAGRVRSEALFKKMYGASAAAVQKTLVPVPWFGQTIRFTRINGAADSLRKVADEIARHPELKQYVTCAGTFYWRPVRGAKRLSAHSFGIAIDVAVAKSDYWKWQNPRATETTRIRYANRIPAELVKIFEKHGFIWGGAWYHYDTMHFEYRPEILKYGRGL